MPPPDELDAKFWSAVVSDHRAATFAAKESDLFANAEGKFSLDTDPAVTDRLWNPCFGAWSAGKAHPKLALPRLNAEQAEIRLARSSLVAGIKTMLGYDLSRDHAENVANIALD